MSAPAINVQIIQARADIFSPSTYPNRRIKLRLPKDKIKEVYETLVWQEETETGDRIVYKLYRNRGAFKDWSRHLSPSRASREFARLSVLHNAGVRCCEPLVYGRGRSPEHGRYELLGTREIPNAIKLAEFLESFSGSTALPNLNPLFDTIRSMHQAGLYHGTLTPNNIVVSRQRDDSNLYYVVDLPRAFDFPYDLANTKMAWYDLLHFTHRTTPYIGREACLPLLDHYDFSEPVKQNYLRDLEQYRPTKSMRYRLRNEFSWKSRIAKRKADLA